MSAKGVYMIKFNEIKDRNQRDEIVLLFSNWLKCYSQQVIVQVIARTDEIINNEFAMKLLRELKAREDKETYDFANSIGSLMIDFDDLKDYNPHNLPLTHANSYREVLYDMYIL